MDFLEESSELNEFYRLYGIASHNCSYIESRIVHLLLGPEWKRLNKLNPDKIKKVYKNLSRKTLGQLLKIYQSHFDFNTETLEHMEMVLEKRNYLIHRFFHRGIQLHNADVLKEATEELIELISIFQEASELLNPPMK